MNIKLLSIALLLFISKAAVAQTPFTISGQLSPAIDAKKVTLSYKNNGVYVSDSTTVSAGKFTFKGIIGDPAYAKLTIDPPAMLTMQNIKTVDSRDFFIDGGKIEIKGATKLNRQR